MKLFGRKKTPLVGTSSRRDSSSDTDIVEAQSTQEKDIDANTEPQDRPSTSNEEDVTNSEEHSTGLRLALLTLGLFLGTFVVALDNTIIATAIPKITDVFNSLDDVGWYGSGYLLTTTSLQPSFGKLYACFNVKGVFLSALAIFEVGSIICAAATSSTMLIIGRAVAGIGAAGLFSGCMTIVGLSVPLHRRPMYISALASVNGIASVVGPIMGGAFTDNVTWRWCFWINLPFGGISMIIVFLFFRTMPRPYMALKDKLKQLDMGGAVVFIGGMICCLLALQWGGTTYAWSHSQVWGCLMGFGVLIILFIGIQIKLGDRATMPPRLFKNRTVTGTAMFTPLIAMGMQTHIYYLPFYFQAVKGTPAEQSGIRCIPYLVSLSVFAFIAGSLVTALGPYKPFLWMGTAIFCIGSGILYTLEPMSSAGEWIGYQILAGAGLGTCYQAPYIAIQVVLSEKDMPLGNAIAFFFTTLGGSIAVSVAQNIFSNTLVSELPRLARGVDVANVVRAGATHFRQLIPPNLLTGAVQAYGDAVTNAFILPIAATGAAFLSTFLFEWKSVKAK